MKCTTCAHPQRQAIDQALLAGDATYEAISRQYGPSISALYRHRKHLEAKTRRARQRLRDNLSLGFFCKLNNFLAQIQNAAQTADAEGNAAVVLQAATVGTRIITSLAKQELPLELDMVYRFLASPQWAAQDSLLPTDPQLFTDSHQAIAASLFFPCPELTLPDLDDAADADGSAEAAAEPDDRAAKAGVAEELSRLLSRLDLDPTLALPSILATPGSKLETSPTANRQLAAANHSRIKREKSAKLPRNSRPAKVNNKQYQLDNISEKISAKNPCVGRDPQGGASQSVAPPANHLESNAAPPAHQPSLTLRPHSTLKPPSETGHRQPETAAPELGNPLPPGISPELLRQILPRLDQIAPSQAGNQKLETENQARNNREKSAKLPRLSRFFKYFSKQYQKDTLSEKISAPNPCVGRDPQGGASQSGVHPADYLADSTAPPTNQPSLTRPPAIPKLEIRNSELKTLPAAPAAPDLFLQAFPFLVSKNPVTGRAGAAPLGNHPPETQNSYPPLE